MIQICRKDKEKVYEAIRTGKIDVAEMSLADVPPKEKSPDPFNFKGFRRPCQESMRQDLNLRPLRPERSALPS